MNQMCLLHTLKSQIFSKTLYSVQTSANVHTKISPTAKRGILLSRMVSPARDKAKHWHYKILDNAPKAKNVFEKVHRPSRRQIVLNSLFIKNITDVLSTGDVAPEVMGYGIEITKVKVSPCCKILNVYWQIPPSSFSLCEDIEAKLNTKTRAIRAELISRNLMGKVPHIFFIRDHTNARLAAFEAALKDVEAEIKEESSAVLNDEFLEDILSFKSAKKRHQGLEEKPDPVIEKDPEEGLYPPPRPSDMKCNVFGLRHDVLMDRVMAAKKKTKPSEHEFVGAEARPSEDGDLFSRISGETLDSIDREKLLKQFQVERKKLRSRKKEENEDEYADYEWQSYNENESFTDNFEEDYYIENEGTDKN